MTPAPRRRTGFTLIELLVVITIIGVLIALLVPVVWSAVNQGNDARVAGEINTLASALASFKNKYQEFPPSRIVLAEDGGFDIGSEPPFFSGMTYTELQPNIGGSANPPVLGTPDLDYPALAQRSITYMRKFFPKAAFVPGVAAPTIPGGGYDFNGNGNLDQLPIFLEGHECLVFFLGGIPTQTSVNNSNPFTLEGVGGFSANPRNPFLPQFQPDGTTNPGAQNRIEPFFEFDADRLIDDDGDGMPGYVDPMGQTTDARYFAYFSSYGGSGYDPNDVNLALSEPGTSAGTMFSTTFPLADGTRRTASPLPNPYTSSLPVTVGQKPATFHNAQSFQIVSAGRDRNYGPGGQYDPNSPNDSLSPNGGPDPSRERDNITNFSNGTLE